MSSIEISQHAIQGKRTKIQRLVLGMSGLGLPENLYVSKRRKAVLDRRDKCIELMPGGLVELNSYFNAFPLCEWRERIDLSSLGLTITFEGQLCFRIRIHRKESADSTVEEQNLFANTKKEEILHAVFSNLGAVASNEIVSLVFWSERGAKIYSCDWFTTEQPRKHVKLGAIITHFNRQQWVTPAIERLRSDLLTDTDFKDLAELVIVDNSANLEVRNGGGVTKITSSNFGCSGGFARGLLHLVDDGNFSHALFMDDDATCEIESLKRTINIFQFEGNPSNAVAGTLFCEPHFDKIYEAGACWSNTWYPVNRNLKPQGSGLNKLSENYCRSDYGGWWFFAFPIGSDLKFPFPFFLRGDDISFGLANKFRISTPIGVACWAENFAGKDSPYLKYLDARMHALIPLVFGTCTLPALLRILNKIVFDALVSYRYSAARAVLAGISDALQDSDFWERNANGLEFRSRLEAEFRGEIFRLAMAEAVSSSDFRNDFKETAFRRLLRKATLGGYLLPSAVLPRARVVMPKNWVAPNKLVFPYRKIRFVDQVTGKLWDTDRSVIGAFAILVKLVATDARVCWAYLFGRKKIKRTFSELSTPDSWRGIFSRARI